MRILNLVYSNESSAVNSCFTILKIKSVIICKFYKLLFTENHECESEAVFFFYCEA